MKMNQKGFSVVEGLLIVLVLSVIGFGGYYVYHSQKSSSKTANLAANSQTSVSGSKSASSSQKADPYAGWKSGMLTYEKVHFKYPANWTVKDQSIGANYGSLGNDHPMDGLFLTSPSGAVVGLNTGALSKEDPIVFDRVPITFLGSTTDLLIEDVPSQSGTPTQPREALLNFPAKNITTSVCPSGSGQRACATYDSFSYIPNGAHPTSMSASQLEASPDFATAKLIFESMSY